MCAPTLPQPNVEAKATAATCKVQHAPQALQAYRNMFTCVRLLQGLFCSLLCHAQ